MKKNNIINRLDPRSKMIFTFFMVATSVFLDIPHNIVLLILLIFITFFSEYTSSYYFMRVLKIYPMIFLISFLLPFQSSAGQADIMFTLNKFSVYRSGLERFAALNLNYLVIILSTMILTTTTSFSRIVKGLEFVKLPYWFIAVIIFMFRLIYLLKNEIEKMYYAYQSRYVSLPYFSRIKIAAQMSGVYFVRMVERNERTHAAMVSRGFSGRCPSTQKLKWQLRDSLVTAGGLFFIILILIIR